MTKILIRAGISPINSHNPSKLIVRNLIGSNVGNLVYQFGIFRALINENVQVIPDNYDVERCRITDRDIEHINKKYDAYICPLADAIRENYIEKLNFYVKFIEKLDIPFIISGIGLRTNVRDDGTKKFPFDDNITNFINAVVDNGTIIGVRGKITGNYLSNLGFKENRDFIVIGCPSMFSYGTHINIQDKEINEKSLISINSSLKSQKPTLKFISNLFKKYPNHYFIPQWLSEFKLTYLGKPDLKVNDKIKKKFYPTKITSSEYEKNNVRYPVNTYGWIELLKTVDMSFGTRLHGNIAATLAGTPNIMVIKDGRMKDVVDYHELTRIDAHELKNYNSIEEIIESVDFHSTEKNHEKRFEKYISFWQQNNIKTIYDDDFYRKDSPIDIEIKAKAKPPVETISKLTQKEISMRLKEYRNERVKWEIEKIKNECRNLSLLKMRISNFIKKNKETSLTMERCE